MSERFTPPTLKIITDGRWKNLKYRYEVPEKVLADQFDYLDDDVEDGFFQYRKNWYHISDFIETLDPQLKKAGFHGYSGDSYFSGVALKLSSDCEQYKVATVLA